MGRESSHLLGTVKNSEYNLDLIKKVFSSIASLSELYFLPHRIFQLKYQKDGEVELGM